MSTALKIAQPGWNSLTAPDWALVFNSDWPSLQIANEFTLSYSDFGGNSSKLISHTLGFVPLTMSWLSSSSTSYGRQYPNEISSTYIFIFRPPIGSTVTVRMYNVQISREASYPLPVSASFKTPADLNNGIKIVKQNPARGINSPNLNDYILNSQAQSPAILDVITETGQYFSNNISYKQYTGLPGIVYPLRTSYIPFVAGYSGLDVNGGDYYQISNNLIVYNQTSNTLTMVFGEANTVGTLVIFRDPLFHGNSVRITY